MSPLPWLCFGDFNEILNLNKKLGGLDKSAEAIREFREAIRDCNLFDLGSRGYSFTWSNKQFGPQLIQEKLDRFLCNQKWRVEFYDDLATNLVHWESDHCPVLMEVKERQRSLSYERKTFTRLHNEDI